MKLVESSDSHKTDWDSFSPGQDFLFEEKELPVNSNHVRLSGHKYKVKLSINDMLNRMMPHMIKMVT